MATRQNRIADFNSGEPPADQSLELLCEDHCGTYVIPFACRWTNNAWFGVPTPIGAASIDLCTDLTTTSASSLDQWQIASAHCTKFASDFY